MSTTLILVIFMLLRIVIPLSMLFALSSILARVSLEEFGK